MPGSRARTRNGVIEIETGEGADEISGLRGHLTALSRRSSVERGRGLIEGAGARLSAFGPTPGQGRIDTLTTHRKRGANCCSRYGISRF